MATISDINQETRDLCDANSTSYTDATLLRRINHALETVIGWLIESDGTWQFDDTNYTDLPIGTGNLVASQESYSFASNFLDIEAVKVKDITGVYRLLQPLDPSEVAPLSVEEYFNSVSGFPQYYDKNGNTIRLYPKPDSASVTLTGGLKVHFKRTASLYTAAIVTTGTQEPGFASPWHYVLSYMAAIPYCQAYKKDRVPLYQLKVDSMKKDMLHFYGNRERDRRKIISTKQRLFR